MDNVLIDMIRRHKAGENVGITSICSAHPLVIEAAILQALADQTHVLLEATSNQVDQYGGYTGMKPVDYRDLVFEIADRVGFPRNRVVLGGDHLGPNTWQSLDPEQAMTQACALVEAYVSAGFTKIHVDCSMQCLGDPFPLTDELVAERTARLVKVAENASVTLFGESNVLYVIGTEVPVPGGAHEKINILEPTSPLAAIATIQCHQQAFDDMEMSPVWDRVIALVVQPGVEFDHSHIHNYKRDQTDKLSSILNDYSHLIFEAHSTDYQTIEHLTQLVQDHWAVLKVGPGLTFALREAFFALALIEDQLFDNSERSHLVAAVERRMLDEPKWWKGYYEGDARAQQLARRYSYSDRMRYYWPDPEIQEAQNRLIANLRAIDVPLPLLSQFLPNQYQRVRQGSLAPEPTALVIDKVRDVLRAYSSACNRAPNTSL